MIRISVKFLILAQLTSIAAFADTPSTKDSAKFYVGEEVRKIAGSPRIVSSSELSSLTRLGPIQVGESTEQDLLKLSASTKSYKPHPDVIHIDYVKTDAGKRFCFRSGKPEPIAVFRLSNGSESVEWFRLSKSEKDILKDGACSEAKSLTELSVRGVGPGATRTLAAKKLGKPGREVSQSLRWSFYDGKLMAIVNAKLENEKIHSITIVSKTPLEWSRESQEDTWIDAGVSADQKTKSSDESHKSGK